MKKFINIFLVLLLLLSFPSVYASEVDTLNVPSDYYSVTVPAILNSGETGSITVEGAWSSDKTLVVQVKENPIKLTYREQSIDVNVNFDGIMQSGQDATLISISKAISIADTSVVFGTWTGTIEYTVGLYDNNGAETNSENPTEDRISFSWAPQRLIVDVMSNTDSITSFRSVKNAVWSEINGQILDINGTEYVINTTDSYIYCVVDSEYHYRLYRDAALSQPVLVSDVISESETDCTVYLGAICEQCANVHPELYDSHFDRSTGRYVCVNCWKPYSVFNVFLDNDKVDSFVSRADNVSVEWIDMFEAAKQDEDGCYFFFGDSVYKVYQNPELTRPQESASWFVTDGLVVNLYLGS